MAVKREQPKSQSKAELLRGKRVRECQQRISEGQQTIEAIHSQQDHMCIVDVIGIPVRHKSFETGTITEQNATSITVNFDCGSKPRHLRLGGKKYPR